MPKEQIDVTRVTLRIPEGMMEKITAVGDSLGLPATKAVMHCLTIGVQASMNTVSNNKSANAVQDMMTLFKAAAAESESAASADRKPKARRPRARA